jgi:hypothetical protein
MGVVVATCSSRAIARSSDPIACIMRSLAMGQSIAKLCVLQKPC